MSDDGIGVVLDLSGERRFMTEKVGKLLEVKADMLLEGDPHISVTVDCGDLVVIGVLRTADFAATVPQLEKGMRVRLRGLFTPTGFEQTAGHLKPFSGLMLVTELEINPPQR